MRVKDRGNFQEYLTSKGIQTVIHYPIPPHKQIAYEEWSGLSFPISESIHNEVISLPMTSVLSKDEITTVINVLNEY
ncbi:dTDP-3-amino-3,6-dideoxy-alpha-D-galactopyranose transaminase [compost metagenome]